MSNGPEWRKLADEIEHSFIKFDLTLKQSILLNTLLLSDYNEFKDTMLIDKKKKQIEILKNEIEKLDERDN